MSSFAAATPDEQRLLRGLVTGELRQGSLDALLLDAVAEAAGVSPDAVRRAAMLAGDTEPVAVAALTQPDPAAALAAFTLVVGRPVRPMLAQSAPDVDAAWASLSPGPVVVDSKLDGIRIQVHRSGSEVAVFTRSLDDITVAGARDRRGGAADARDRPRARRRGDRAGSRRSATAVPGDVVGCGTRRRRSPPPTLTPYFFDCLHIDGEDLIDEPGRIRWPGAPTRCRAHGRATGVSSVEEARRHFEAAVRRGHEGVVVKALQAP